MNKGKSKLYSAIFKYKLTGKTRWIGSKGYLMKYGRKNWAVSIEQWSIDMWPQGVRYE